MTSIVEVYSRWPAKEDCIAHLEAVRWGDTPLCPYCGAERVSHNRDSSRGLTAARWKCQRCLKSFSVTVGTIFHNSHIDLQRWFLLISMLSAKKGLSAMQAARDLDMRRPTVWNMMHRVRKALVNVEMDETYIGGKPRKKNRRAVERTELTGDDMAAFFRATVEPRGYDAIGPARTSRGSSRPAFTILSRPPHHTLNRFRRVRG